MVRNTKGRKKIEMKKITNVGNLQVTFSKRRFGIFKKASELCTLCDAEMFVIVFSPSGKAFSFGHRDVKDLVDQFSSGNHNSVVLHQHNKNLQHAEITKGLNEMLTDVLEKQESEKKKKKDLESLRVSREKRGNWYEKDVKILDMDQTNNLICGLQDMKKKLIGEISQYPHLNVSQNFLGTFGGSNVDVGIDHFDQGRNVMVNYNPDMVFPNGSLFGYSNNGVILLGSKMNCMPNYNFNKN